MKKSLTLFIGVILLLAVGIFVSSKEQIGSQSKNTEQYSNADLNEQLVMSVLWMEKSAEYRALCYQTFNLAKLRIDEELQKSHSKPLAVVVDVDETVLSNSAYEAWLIGKDKQYSKDTWSQWINDAEATALPGATEFLNYANSKGVSIFYLTNRHESTRVGTLKNIQNVGFPNADNEHLLLKTTTGNKSPRREIVNKDYEVAIYMGDSLTDFTNEFAGKSIEEQKAIADQYLQEWGDKFIVLPNSEYGNWDGAIIENKWGAPASEKDAMRKAALERWQPKNEEL
jgi:5'-nucleotidase (lipoprotein e(P4) family)